MFNHLKVPESWNSYFSKYPNGLTIMEALVDWVGQVDLMVDHINTVDEHIDYLNKNLEEFYLTFQENLSQEIMNTLQLWIEDGTLGEVIAQLIEGRMVFQNIQALQAAPNVFELGTVVELLGYYTAGDGAGHKRIISDSDDGSGVAVGSKFANICEDVVNIAHFGASTASTDNVSQIQKAFDYLQPRQKVVVPEGTFKTSTVKLAKNDVEIECIGELVRTGITATALIVLGTVDAPTFRIKGSVKVLQGTPEHSIANTGILIINLNDSNLFLQAQNFTTNIELLGQAQGVAYNTFTLGTIKNGFINLLFTRKDVGASVGWVNENKFIGGRFCKLSGSDITEGTKHLFISHQSMNNNVFFSPSFENAMDTFVECLGQFNTFYSPRFEGTANTYINYNDANARGNLVDSPYFVERLTETTKIKNIGRFNEFNGRYSKDMNAKSIVNAGISAIFNPSANSDGPDCPVVVRNTLGGSTEAVKVLATSNPYVKAIVLGTEGDISAVGKVMADKGAEFKSGSYNSSNAIVVKATSGTTTFSVNGSGAITGNGGATLRNSSSSSNPVISVQNAGGSTTPLTIDGNGNLTTTGIITASNIVNVINMNEPQQTLQEEVAIGTIRVGEYVEIFMGEVGWKKLVLE